MKLPTYAIRNHQFTLMMFVLLIFFGVSGYLVMPRAEDPFIEPPEGVAFVIYPGASPEDIESLIVDPLEERLKEIDDVEQIDARIEDGVARVRFEWDPTANRDDMEKKIEDALNATRAEFPEGVLDAGVIFFTTYNVNVVQLALLSESATDHELRQTAENIKDELERIPGLKDVKIEGAQEEIVRVSVDAARLAQYRLPLTQVIAAIQSYNANIPGGSIDLGPKKLNIRTSGEYESLDEIRRTIVGAANAKPVYLADVAQVDFGYADPVYKTRFNSRPRSSFENFKENRGKPRFSFENFKGNRGRPRSPFENFKENRGRRGVFIAMRQKKGVNVISLNQTVREKVTALRQQLPRSMQLEIAFDQSESVRDRINGFLWNLLQGMALVGLVIFLVMRWRTSLIVMLAIPISFVIALGFVQALGYGLQQMTIVALVIALGLLVDNAIVVTENINRFLRQGKDPLSAVAEATSQVGWAVASATLTTVLAFLPIVLMKDVSGDFIRSMPVTVMITLISSLLVALTLTPLLSYWLLRPTSAATRITRLVNYLLEHQYRASLNWALGHRKTVLAIATMAFFGSLALFPLVGVSFFPKAEKPQFVVNVRLPKGSSLEATDAVTRQVESVLLAQPEVKSVATNVGKGNPLIYYNVQRENEKTNYAQLFVQLQKQNSGRRTEELVAALRRQFSEYPGAKIEAKEFEQGPPVEAPVLVRVRGDDLPALTRLASQVERILNEIPGTVNVDNPLATQATDLQIDINKDKAALLGVPLAEIDRTVRIAMAGFAASIYRDDEGESYPIVVRLPAAPVWAEPRRAEQTDAANGTNGVSGKTSYESLSQIYVASVTGAQIPLAQLAKFRFRAGYGVIMHRDLSRMVSVTSDVNGRTAAEVSADLEAALKQLRLPPGFSVQIGGESESRGESFTSLYQATVIALVAILGVLVLQFRSFAQPLIIFSTIPLGVIGVILGLLFSGNSFSFSAFVGLTSLVGIVVNNSILLVEYANQLRAEGHSVSEAIRQAAATRFLPILLTTGTTVGGLLPLTLGGGTLWAPMGWAIIGGLAVSTFLTLLVTPVLYEMLTKRT